jgi:uncharacterized protein
LPLELLAPAALVIAGGYLVFALTGFGSTVLVLPVLVHFVPLKFAVPLLLLLDLSAGVLLGARARQGIRFDELAWLAPFMLAGMAIGLTLLIRLAEAPLIATLGAFVLVYAAWGLAARRAALPALARAWCAPIGFAGGAFSALFGTGGVLVAVYTAGRIRDKAELRATNAAAIVLTALVRVALFAAAGLLAQEGLLLAAALLFPAMLIGFAAGNRLHASVSAAAVVRVVYALLIVSGVSLVLRAAAM